jgi:hypothetical protein
VTRARCAYVPSAAVATSANFKLPYDLKLIMAKEMKSGGDFLPSLADVFGRLQQEIFSAGARSPWMESLKFRWERLTAAAWSAQERHLAATWSVQDWSDVVARVAAEGYEPYIAASFLSEDPRRKVESVAAEVIAFLEQHPHLEPSYQELASRTVVGAAVGRVEEALLDIDDKSQWGEETREEVQQALVGLLPLLCSAWTLGREVAAAEARGEFRSGVRWRQLVFQGLRYS